MKIINYLLLIFFTTNILTAQDKAPTDCSIAEIESLLDAFKATKAYNKFIPYAQVGMEKAAKQLGKQDTTYAKMLFYMGFGSQVMQDFANAANFFQQAIEIQKAQSPKSPRYATSLHHLGILYHSTGNFPIAEPLYKEALQIRKEVFGSKNLEYSNTLNNLAALYKDMGNYSMAEPLYKEALQIRKEGLGVKHPEYGNSLNNLAGLYFMMGQYASAEPFFVESAKIKKEVFGEKHPEYAGSLNHLATFYRGIGNHSLAEYYFQEALKIYKEVLEKKGLDYVTLINNLAGFYIEIKNYALAEPLYKEALQIKKEILGEKHPEYASSLFNLALLNSSLENYPLAESLFKEALGIWKATLGEKHPSYAANLNELAILYKKTNNYLLAEPLFKEAIKIRQAALGNKHSDYAMSLCNLADLYLKMRNYALAESLYKEALQIQKEVFGERHFHYIGSLTSLAELYAKMGDYKKAWSFIQQSLSSISGFNISVNISDSWADSLLSSYHNIEAISQTLLLVHDLLPLDSIQQKSSKNSLQTNQIIVADLALKLLQKSRNGFLAEDDKLRILNTSNKWVLKGLADVDKETQAEKAFAFAEQSKSILLLDAAQNTTAQSFGDLPDSLVQKELALQKKRSECEAGILEKRPEAEKDQLRALLNKLNFEIKDFQSNVEKSFPKYAALKYLQKETTVQEIQKRLDDKTALLEYVLEDSVVYAFYLDNKNIRFLHLPISKTELTSKVKKLHRALSDYAFILQKKEESYQEYTESAHWFYKNLVAATMAKSQGISNLIIVTDGELGFLPFEAFLVKQPPQVLTDYSKLHYLVNDFKISYNYSATLFVDAARNKEKSNNASKKNGQFLAMASSYEATDTSSTFNSKKDSRLPVYQRLRATLSPLPAAEKEVETLQKTFQGFFAFGKDASEKNFKEKASDYAIIHLAMHGLLDVKNPILSSLAFTEEGDSIENNFLQAFEISKMKLNADLVVLSACETGYGKIEKGNGLASLARAFMYAGASAMVVSLWQVNDHSTSLIMQNFYTNLAKGMAKHEALQEAKLQYIKAAQDIAGHPAFWSPFILMGNTDAITLESKNGWLWWGIGGGVLLLGGIAFAIRSKKRE